MAAMRDDIPLATHYFVVLLKCSTPDRCSQHDYDTLAFVLPQRQAPESASCIVRRPNTLSMVVTKVKRRFI